jgi:hypothetical protein
VTDQQPKLGLITPIGVDLVSIQASETPDPDHSLQVRTGRDTGGLHDPIDAVHVLAMSESTNTVSPVETVNAEQLCALLDISMRTLKRWRQIGEGPVPVRVGRGYVYRTVTVLRWMEEREQVASTQRAS